MLTQSEKNSISQIKDIIERKSGLTMGEVFYLKELLDKLVDKAENNRRYCR